ncbi:hypothetical protein Lal_00008633 [Lupinus albus]|nr:hypothetical protein Lal_00008633 [Lupinus albus]
MPIFDDRFARQNRCEPPPEFLWLHPYRHSSPSFGSAPYALTQIHPRTSGSVDDAPKLSPAFTFITRRGLTPEHSHTKTTPWSVFQDGSLMTITPASLQMREPQSPPGYTQRAITLPEESHIPEEQHSQDYLDSSKELYRDLASNQTGLSPSMASRSRELGRHRIKSILYKLQLGPESQISNLSCCRFHPPLLGQSLLVSFPPLIDMLKFSGYSYLIRGQHSEVGV